MQKQTKAKEQEKGASTPAAVAKVPKARTEEERLGKECLVFGRKLEGIFTNGNSICAQM